MEVSIEEKPFGIKVEKKKSGSSIIQYPVNSFSFGKSSPISRISVYHSTEAGKDEKVVFDSGVLIKREDDIKFLISPEKSISGFLEIIVDEDEILSSINSMKLRVNFGA